MMIGLCILSYGAAMYIEANLGISPYDSLSIIAAENFNKNYTISRITQDVISVMIGFFLGSTVGIATVLIALSLGYLISHFRTSIRKRFFC